MKWSEASRWPWLGVLPYLSVFLNGAGFGNRTESEILRRAVLSQIRLQQERREVVIPGQLLIREDTSSLPPLFLPLRSKLPLSS